MSAKTTMFGCFERPEKEQPTLLDADFVQDRSGLYKNILGWV
jgi:hypothetical protein